MSWSCTELDDTFTTTTMGVVTLQPSSTPTTTTTSVPSRPTIPTKSYRYNPHSLTREEILERNRPSKVTEFRCFSQLTSIKLDTAPFLVPTTPALARTPEATTTTTPEATGEFNRFNQLPVELRDLIWKFSYPSSQCLEIRSLPKTPVVRKFAFPTALQVCQESRAEALRYYHKLSGFSQGFINFNIDTLYLHVNSAKASPMLSLGNLYSHALSLEAAELHSVKKLAISMQVFRQRGALFARRMLELFSEMEELTLVVWEGKVGEWGTWTHRPGNEVQRKRHCTHFTREAKSLMARWRAIQAAEAKTIVDQNWVAQLEFVDKGGRIEEFVGSVTPERTLPTIRLRHSVTDKNGFTTLVQPPHALDSDQWGEVRWEEFDYVVREGDKFPMYVVL